MAMSATSEFFSHLGDRGPFPLLSRTTGSVRVDVVDGPRTEHWTISIDRGDVGVTRGAVGDADCSVRADRACFERLLAGRENGMAAVLRGAVSCTGDAELLVQFHRLFPGPPGQKVRGSRAVPTR
jgi:ubiquinone biosynthesis protein UbiJ